MTQDFGALPVGYAGTPRVSGQETVMSLLQRNYEVKTRYGGGFVESVNGHAGGTQAGEPIDWFYYVNGVEAPKGAAETNVESGDRIWWDLHDWSQTDNIPAVVGSFPEPFVGGIEGKRYPVRVECSEASSSACATVHTRLSALGVPVAGAAVSDEEEQLTMSVLVGPYSALGNSLSVHDLERRSALQRRLRPLLRWWQRAQPARPCWQRRAKTRRGSRSDRGDALWQRGAGVAHHRHQRGRCDARRELAARKHAAQRLRACARTVGNGPAGAGFGAMSTRR